MNLDYEIDFKEKRVYVLTDGKRKEWNSLSFQLLSTHKKKLLEIYPARGAIYSIAHDYLIDHGFLTEEKS